MSKHSESATAELLAMLAEELGEAVQAVGKSLRHGLESVDPTGRVENDNAESIERELGDVMAIGAMLVKIGVLDRLQMQQRKAEKLAKVQQWMHHGQNMRIAEACRIEVEAELTRCDYQG